MTCHDCQLKNDLIGKLASHLAAASEVLGQLARKDGATGTPDAAGIALIALRWEEAL